MSQVTNWSVANAGGAAVRAAMNGIFGAIQSSNSGAAAPSPTVAGMVWLDTSATPAVWKLRNAANTGWIVVGAETIGAKRVRGNSAGSAGPEADIDMATLATMLGFASSIGDPGYVTLPGGLIIQWGVTGTIAAGGGQAVTFPLTFPAACFLALVSPITIANNTSGFSVGSRDPATTGFTATHNSGTSGPVTASWLAIGN